ncbi:hypothetical protein PCE1_002850 [Barthelona sp. PCE]
MPTVKRESEDDYIDVQTPFEYVLDLNQPDTTLLVALRKFMVQNDNHVVTDTRVLKRLINWLDTDVIVGEHEENLLWVLTNLARETTFLDFGAVRYELLSAVVEKTALKWAQERRIPDEFLKDVFVQNCKIDMKDWIRSNLLPHISEAHVEVDFSPLCRTLHNIACVEPSNELFELVLLFLNRDFEEKELRELIWLFSKLLIYPTAYKAQIFRFLVNGRGNHSEGAVYEALFCFINYFLRFNKDVEIFNLFFQYVNDTMPLIIDLQNDGKLDIENELMAIMNMHCSRVESTFAETIALVQRDNSVVLD